MSAIEVRNLRRAHCATIGVLRRKTKEVVAVEDISSEVQPGELSGLLGPHGRGKTTTFLATDLVTFNEIVEVHLVLSGSNVLCVRNLGFVWFLISFLPDTNRS
jgi:ABC-type glutathione transport system ATPase component